VEVLSNGAFADLNWIEVSDTGENQGYVIVGKITE
jgi:hypothetical protein